FTKTTLLGSIFIFLIPGAFALIGVGFFFRVYRVLEPGSAVRTKVIFFILGASLLIIGALIFGILGLISPYEYNPVLTMVVIILWALGPVCIVWGLYGVRAAG
ncbi:MAG: hypothetical protein ACFFBD_09580, partial [Candidatus Hodarchaeota archaeon]